MSYTHLTLSERVKIETYLELDDPIRKIAKRLNRQPSTISREIKRHAGSTADEAQVRYHSHSALLRSEKVGFSHLFVEVNRNL